MRIFEETDSATYEIFKIINGKMFSNPERRTEEVRSALMPLTEEYQKAEKKKYFIPAIFLALLAVAVWPLTIIAALVFFFVQALVKRL